MKRLSLIVSVLMVAGAVQLTAAQGTFTNDGPVVERMKAAVAAYEVGDWAKYRTAYADTVTITNNLIEVSLDERIEEHMAIHSVFENIRFVDPIYGAVEIDGETWALLWGTWSGTVRSSGKPVELAVHIASLQAGGKTALEYGIWDTSDVAPIMEAAMKDQ